MVSSWFCVTYVGKLERMAFYVLKMKLYVEKLLLKKIFIDFLTTKTTTTTTQCKT